MIGIVILNYMNWKDTVRCVKSICESETDAGGPDYRIYVVDNASTALPPEEFNVMVENREITFVSCKENLGYAAGNNRGIRQALKDGCDEVLISNNDVIFDKHCIRNLHHYLMCHPEVGIAGPKILDEKGEIQKSCLCRKTSLKEKYLVRTRLNVLFRKQHASYFGLDRDYNCCFPVYAVHGSCFMISGKCVREVFPFDEGTFLYEEEYIVGIRMEEAGYETHYVPDGVIYHLHGRSTDGVKPFAYTCECMSEIYYCHKYLNANRYQILPLYIYRILKYYGKCVKNREYWKYRGEFSKKRKAAWRGNE